MLQLQILTAAGCTFFVAWNVAHVKNFYGFAAGNANFSVDISAWDTRRARDMTAMFRGASAFNISLGGWNTTQVEEMSQMFHSTLHLFALCTAHFARAV